MIIGVDGNEANVLNKVGVSVYTAQLLQYFAEHANEATQFLVYIKNQPLAHLPEETKFYRYKVVLGKKLWSQIFLPLHLFTHREIAVFFSPAHYTPRFCPVPVVVTIHDLAHITYPNEFLPKDRYTLEHWTAHAIKQAQLIIAVSKHTKKDIMQYYQVPPEKIAVIYNGFEKNTFMTPLSNGLEKLHLEKNKYIVYIGTLQPRKNIIALIRAFKVWQQKHVDWKLVIAGKKGWLFEPIFQEIEQLHLKESVIIPGFVNDDSRAMLYQNAFCLVHPSLYEGFGITLLEAMSQQCPVITSFVSSLPEVAGEAALYFDPLDPEEIVKKLTELEDNPQKREELIKKGLERISQFSWEKCGKQTLSVLSSI